MIIPNSENIRAIIICAGEASRWNNHTSTPKHLVSIEGENILHRTIRLLRLYGVTDIYVVSKDDSRYNIGGSKQYIVEPNYKDNGDADKFLSSEPIWNTKGKTLILYGDCYFTDNCIRAAINSSIRRNSWFLMCRPDGSKITGSKYGECFIYSIPSKDLGLFREHLNKLAKLHTSKQIDRCGGWELYRSMCGVDNKDLRTHKMYTNWYLVNDWTEDFDFPADFENWNRLRIQKIGINRIITI